MSAATPEIAIPADLLPHDGRFGSGPSKVRNEAVEALAKAAPDYMGTSHRQATVRFVVGALRNGLPELLNLPDGYEIVLGNGGTTAFWDAAAFGLIERRSQHLSFGEFSSKFAAEVAGGAVPRSASRSSSPRPAPIPLPVADARRRRVLPDAQRDVDRRRDAAAPAPMARPADQLVLVDATSAAGGLRFDASQIDVYYFAPQKNLGSDGGLWLAAMSPAAIERAERIATTVRTVGSRRSSTCRPPSTTAGRTRRTTRPRSPHCSSPSSRSSGSTATADSSGPPRGATSRPRSCTDGPRLRAYAAPFVADPAQRSHVVGTIDLDPSIDATTVSDVLRRNGVVDTDSYRKLGRNQLRIAMFTAIDPDDIAALTHCIDYVVDSLT